jgi:hypothetical protein
MAKFQSQYIHTKPPQMRTASGYAISRRGAGRARSNDTFSLEANPRRCLLVGVENLCLMQQDTAYNGIFDLSAHTGVLNDERVFDARIRAVTTDAQGVYVSLLVVRNPVVDGSDVIRYDVLQRTEVRVCGHFTLRFQHILEGYQSRKVLDNPVSLSLDLVWHGLIFVSAEDHSRSDSGTSDSQWHHERPLLRNGEVSANGGFLQSELKSMDFYP